MRYLLSLLLLTTLLPVAQAQDKEAEKLFRDMEKKLQAANAVQLTVDIELRAIKGREEDSRLKDKASKANGYFLFTKDNKARLKISGEYADLELVSDGKKLKLAGEMQPIGAAKAMATPNHLHGLLSTVASRAGVMTGIMIVSFAPGPQFAPVFLTQDIKDFDPDNMKMGVSDFKAGPPEKIAGRDAKVVSYKYGPAGDPDSVPVTLWIDTKTLLPLKRVLSLKFENLHITEIYTDFKLDPKVDAKAFELVPAAPNEAEKLFRTMEDKIKAAKAVLFTFDIDIISSDTEKKGKGKQAKSKGSLLFTKDNQARLKMSVPEENKEVTIEMISDGKNMKYTEAPQPLAKADEERPPTNLHSLLSTMVSGPGLLLTYDDLNFPAWITHDLLSPGSNSPAGPQFRLAYFNGGAAEKVGGRDAKVITYNAVLRAATIPVTLWIDAKTMLPLKRVIVAEGNGETVRITEICNFDLNPKIDATVFTLPK